MNSLFGDFFREFWRGILGGVRGCFGSCFFFLVYVILGPKTKNTVYSRFLSLTVEKTISYYYLLSLLVPIISYYSFFLGRKFEKSEKLKIFIGPRLGTDTPGPGEAVFAIRFNGKPQFSWKKWNFRIRKNSKKNQKKNFFLFIHFLIFFF